MAESLKRIRTPLREHVRQIRYQLLPVLVFLLGVYATVQLWSRHIALPNAVGEVQAIRIDILCPVDGVLVGSVVETADGAESLKSLDWNLFDSVDPGDIVCRLDDAPVKAEIATLKSEKVRLTTELASVDAQMKLEYADRQGNQINEARRLAVDLERMKLDVADRTITLEANRIALKRRGEKLAIIKELVSKNAESQFVLSDTQLSYDVTAKEVQEQEKALKEAVALRDSAAKRLEAYSAADLQELNVFLAPIRAAIATQQATVQEAEVELKALDIRVPPSLSKAKIVAIYRRPGQAVQAGEPIMTIASPDSAHIVSYVRQDPRLNLAENAPVVVHMRSIPLKAGEARITQIGPQIELVPLRQLRDPTVPEWGLPVQIAIPSEWRSPVMQLKPGELVDITFTPTQ